MDATNALKTLDEYFAELTEAVTAELSGYLAQVAVKPDKELAFDLSADVSLHGQNNTGTVFPGAQITIRNEADNLIITLHCAKDEWKVLFLQHYGDRAMHLGQAMTEYCRQHQIAGYYFPARALK